ncbi:hypothetical protein [Mycobacterium spongiae]|uniref:Uncharacterized protein n=1 Tax=Mycobacterium spongiae TaxID=886343 RepID=A0A975JXH0_9MYCO|nr:hypothetical protein [Mycobacterium spongiae]QUR67494.1 hypothetical protein F6B93_10650 [Mycobacterium spongiae]
MNNGAAPAVELRLLTHRPAEVTKWWAALLDATARSLSATTTTIGGASLRVVVECSQIALDYHPEASGVTAISLALPNLREVHRTVNRLARLNSYTHRATRQGRCAALWFHDPNGTEVALHLPASVADHTATTDALYEELDPAAVLAYIGRTTSDSAVGQRDRRRINSVRERHRLWLVRGE